MKYRVLCADGKDRLQAEHATLDEATFDAGYFTGRHGCSDWTGPSGLKDCPGGEHTVSPALPEAPESEPLLAWAV